MGCTMVILFDCKTNNLGLAYLGINQDILGISHNFQLGSFPAAPGLPGRRLVLPVGPRGMATPSPILQHSDSPILGLSH